MPDMTLVSVFGRKNFFFSKKMIPPLVFVKASSIGLMSYQGVRMTNSLVLQCPWLVIYFPGTFSRPHPPKGCVELCYYDWLNSNLDLSWLVKLCCTPQWFVLFKLGKLICKVCWCYCLQAWKSTTHWLYLSTHLTEFYPFNPWFYKWIVLALLPNTAMEVSSISGPCLPMYFCFFMPLFKEDHLQFKMLWCSTCTSQIL